MIPEASVPRGSKPHAALQIDALSNGNLKSLNETRLTVDIWVRPMENPRVPSIPDYPFDISPTIYSPYTADILLFANFDFVQSFEGLSGPNSYES